MFLGQTNLFDSDFGAAHGLAGEAADATGLEGDDTVLSGVQRKVTAVSGAFAGALGQADLTDDNLAFEDFLATKKLDAEALAG